MSKSSSPASVQVRSVAELKAAISSGAADIYVVDPQLAAAVWRLKRYAGPALAAAAGVAALGLVALMTPAAPAVRAGLKMGFTAAGEAAADTGAKSPALAIGLSAMVSLSVVVGVSVLHALRNNYDVELNGAASVNGVGNFSGGVKLRSKRG